MKKTGFLFIILLAFLVTGCTEAAPAEPYGFLMGLWQGLIAPFAFIVSLFNDAVVIYSCNNTGGWYDFGFLLGIGAFAGGSSR